MMQLIKIYAMHTNKKILKLLIGTYAIFFILISNQTWANPNFIVSCGEWPPYSGQSLDEYGAAPEILKHVFTSMIVPYFIVFYPWKRAELMVEEGLVSASCPWFHTAARQNKYLYSSEPLFSASTLIYYCTLNPALPKNVEDQNIKNLNKFRFGGVHGYYYENFLIKEEYAYYPTTSSEQAFQMLIAGRVDFVIEDELVGNSILNKIFHGKNDRIYSLKNEFMTNNMYVIFPKNPHLVSKKFISDFEKNLKYFKTSKK